MFLLSRMLCFLNVSESGLGATGSGGDAITEINNLNKILFNISQYAGAVVIAIAVVQIIMSLQEQNPAMKTRGSLLLGLGIVLISVEPVVTTLGLLDTTTLTGTDGAKKLALNVIDVFGRGLTYTGVVLAAIAIIQLIIALSNEDAREKMEGSKLLAIGIALLSAPAIINPIAELAVGDKSAWGGLSTGEAIIVTILRTIGKVTTYIGAGLLIFGIYHFALAIKEADGQTKAKAALQIGIGIALISIRIILNTILGPSLYLDTN